jgi:VWFA-related protein
MLCLADGGWAAQSAPSSGPVFTIQRTVQRVVLDVVVTDRHGHPVRGLTRKDFSVYEDRVPQQIRSFDAVDMPPVKPLAELKLAAMPAGMYMNVQKTQVRGPLNVIVYDAVHMEPGDQPRARRQLEEFVESKPKGTEFALFMLANDFRLLQGFTTNPAKLMQAFDMNRKGEHIPYAYLMGPNNGADDVDMPYEVMAFVGHYLEGLPGRKNLIWLSSQFPTPVPMFALQDAIATATGTGEQMAPGPDAYVQAQGFGSSAPTTMGSTWDGKVMRQAIDALNAAQVSVYPVDVAGLKPVLNGMDTQAEHIAEATGGRAYFNTNDFKGAMRNAVENGSNYYEISYEPTNMKMDSSMRKIYVRLDRKGCQLQYRRYYYAEDPETPLTDHEKKLAEAVAMEHEVVAHTAGDRFYAYMQHGAPIDHRIVFRAQFEAAPPRMATAAQMANLEDQPAYFVIRKRNRPRRALKPVPLQKYTIHFLVLDPAALAHPEQQVLEFAACAYDGLGHMLNGISQDAERTEGATGSTKQRPFFRAEQTIEVPTTARWLRVGVRDVNTDRMGTMEIPLPLPNAASETAQADDPPGAKR